MSVMEGGDGATRGWQPSFIVWTTPTPPRLWWQSSVIPRLPQRRNVGGCWSGTLASLGRSHCSALSSCYAHSSSRLFPGPSGGSLVEFVPYEAQPKLLPYFPQTGLVMLYASEASAAITSLVFNNIIKGERKKSRRHYKREIQIWTNNEQ